VRAIPFLGLALSLSSPCLAATDQQLAVAQRLADALTGTGDLAAGDFSQAPGEADRELFARYRKCKAESLKSVRVNREDTNRVMIRFKCPGTPARFPIYISLYFDGEKIAAVQTHNADLLRSENG
jgi:hypothetical protein